MIFIVSRFPYYILYTTFVGYILEKRLGKLGADNSTHALRLNSRE